MTGDQVSYKQDNLKQGIDDLRAAKKAMGQAKEDLQREIRSILGETWVGPSYEAYVSTMREWDQSMQDMETIANDMERTLGTISENYATTQNKVHGMWQG